MLIVVRVVLATAAQTSYGPATSSSSLWMTSKPHDLVRGEMYIYNSCLGSSSFPITGLESH